MRQPYSNRSRSEQNSHEQRVAVIRRNDSVGSTTCLERSERFGNRMQVNRDIANDTRVERGQITVSLTLFYGSAMFFLQLSSAIGPAFRF